MFPEVAADTLLAADGAAEEPLSAPEKARGAARERGVGFSSRSASISTPEVSEREAMKAFLIPLTVATTGARIYVNPDHITFLRETPSGAGSQVVTPVINDGLVLPIVKESLDEIIELCDRARGGERES